MDNLDIHASTKALMNPLVLNLILSYMDAPTLKSARSVCTLWADLGASFLGKQVSVTFENCCRKVISKSKELDSLRPELARSVGLIMLPSHCDWVSLPKNLIANLLHVSHHVVELDVTMSSKFEPALEQLWRMHYFPNLLHLTLTVIMIKVGYLSLSEHLSGNYNANQDDEEDDVEFVVVTPKIPQFLTLPNLKSIKLVVKDQNDMIQDRGISSICQGLLNSSPNILHVAINASFYPDFTPCTKLETLVYTFIRFDDFWVDEEVYVDVPKLTRMLDTCRNYLTRLTLSCDTDWELAQPPILMLPSIPNLMAIEIMDMQPLGNFLHSVHLPNLTQVTFSGYNNGYFSLTDIFKNFHLPHAGITSLDMETVYFNEVETATKIARLFPSVKKLRLKFVICEDETDFLELRDTLGSFATWNLTSALVEIEDVCDSTYVRAVLLGLVTWKALTPIAVKFVGLDGKFGPRFVLNYEMEEILLSCRSLRWIEMSRFRMEEEKRIEFEEFIEEHALPITLSRWEE